MRLSDIADIVMAQVPLCPVPTAFLQCRWAVREYLHRTKAWTAIVSGVWSDNERSCELDCPMETVPALLHEVRVDGREIQHWSGEGPWLTSDKTSKAGPRYWRFVNGELELSPYSPLAEDANTFKVEALAVLTIAARNPDLPGWLDGDEMAYGAMYKLYDMPGQTWSNPNLAAYFADKFGKAIADKRIALSHGGKPGTLTMQAPFVGGYF